MPWPKGKPRKGHVKKDGTPHVTTRTRKKKVAVGMEVLQLPVGTDPFKKVPRKRQLPAPVPELPVTTEEEVVQHWGHVGERPVTEVCPNCLYVYADGGWCEKCGWTAPIIRDPYDSNRGRKFK
jgi:hypothetical protein